MKKIKEKWLSLESYQKFFVAIIGLMIVGYLVNLI